MELSGYPIGIQDFKKLRAQGCVYVGKTAEIYVPLMASALSKWE